MRLGIDLGGTKIACLVLAGLVALSFLVGDRLGDIGNGVLVTVSLALAARASS